METEYDGLGWRAHLRKKRSSHFLTLATELIIGNGLRQGDALYYYIVNVEGRKALLLFLDGKERGRML